MKVDGQRVKRTRRVYTDRYIVRLEVEAVIPVDDPSEPCYEAETVAVLKEVQRRAEAGDVEGLRRVGTVYVRLPE